MGRPKTSNRLTRFTKFSWRNRIVTMRLADAALPTSGAEGVPLCLAIRAIKTARFAKKTTVKILRYVEKKLSKKTVSVDYVKVG